MPMADRTGATNGLRPPMLMPKSASLTPFDGEQPKFQPGRTGPTTLERLYYDQWP